MINVHFSAFVDLGQVVVSAIANPKIESAYLFFPRAFAAILNGRQYGIGELSGLAKLMATSDLPNPKGPWTCGCSSGRVYTILLAARRLLKDFMLQLKSSA
jgi:hypothetical protein